MDHFERFHAFIRSRSTVIHMLNPIYRATNDLDSVVSRNYRSR